MSKTPCDHKLNEEKQAPDLRPLDVAYLEITEAILNNDLDEVKRLIPIHAAVADFCSDDSASERFQDNGFFSDRRHFPETCPLQQFAPKIFEDIADELLHTTYLFLVSRWW